MSTFGIAVGGGPAPGINGVIGAAATRALSLGHRVIGIYDGFSRIMEGDTSRVAELSIAAVERIHLLGGSILVETVFNWPGSGRLMNLAIFRRDIPVLSGTIVVLAAIFVAINILVDVLQALIDPRMRR